MGANKMISTTVVGPVYSTGGFITVTSTGVIDGGPTGVYARFFDITTLSNSGSILGGARAAVRRPARVWRTTIQSRR